MKTATTIEEQIALLKQRGMSISDPNKAKEILADIGYYRLGFYWFPLEEDYPNKVKRSHNFKEGAKFEDAVSLYYFDNDLRNILIPYLHRIEVHFRTCVIYFISNHYKRNPTWFADPKVVKHKFLEELPKIYKDISKNEAIKRHKMMHINDIYAPAWKTLEYMTFGNMLFLFENIKDIHLQELVMDKFGFLNLDAFMSQMKIIRTIRNVCAHGHNLFDIRFDRPIKIGRLKGLDAMQRSTISGGLIVTSAVLRTISENRSMDMEKQVNNLLTKEEFASIRPIIQYISMQPMKFSHRR